MGSSVMQSTPEAYLKKSNFEYSINSSNQNVLSKSIANTHTSMMVEKRNYVKSSEKNK